MTKQSEKSAITKKRIMDAFWKLADTHGLLHVTVSEVMNLAGYNRGTFYVYFLDLNDLIAQTEEEILKDIREELFQAYDMYAEDPHTLFYQRLIHFITKYEDKIFILLGSNGDPTFTKKIREEASSFFRDLIGPDAFSEERDYIAAYTISALIGTLTYWYEHGKKVDLYEMLMTIEKLYVHGVESLISHS